MLLQDLQQHIHLSAVPVVDGFACLSQYSCVGLLWQGELREEPHPRGFLRWLFYSSPLKFPSNMASSLLWRWMIFLSFSQDGNAGDRCKFCYSFQDNPYADWQHHTTNLEGVACSRPSHYQVFHICNTA
jgi:hypothetical protein